MKKPLTLTKLLHELQNCEAIILTNDEEWCDWHELLKVVGRFNDKHTKKIAVVPKHSGYSEFKVLNEDNKGLQAEEVTKILASFNGLFAHSYSKGEFLFYLEQENLI